MKIFSSAGKDFYSARACGLDKEKTNLFHSLASVHYSEGKKLYEQKDFMNSYKELSNSILLDSNSNAFFLRSKIFIERNKPNPDSAEADLSAIIRHAPDSAMAETYYRRGMQREAKSDFIYAADDYRKELLIYAASDASYIKDVYKRKANSEIKLKKYFAAAQDFESAGKKFKDDFCYQLSAEQYFATDSFNKAIDVTSAAEKLSTRRPEIFCLRGRAYFMNGDIKKAKGDFENAVLLDKNNADAEYWIGRVMLKNDKFEDAVNPLYLGTFSKVFVGDAYYYLGYAKIK